MREKYWAMYEQIKFTEYYYYHYQISTSYKFAAIKAFLVITSVASICNWTIWEKWPVFWGILIGFAQILGAIQFLLPYAGRLTAMRFLLPELKLLLHKIDRDWDRVNGYTDKKPTDDDVSFLIFCYDTSFAELENKYTNEVTFPRSKRCKNKADADKANFVKQRFAIESTEVHA